MSPFAPEDLAFFIFLLREQYPSSAYTLTKYEICESDRFETKLKSGSEMGVHPSDGLPMNILKF